MLFWCLVIVFQGANWANSEDSFNGSVLVNDANKDTVFKLEGEIHLDVENITVAPNANVYQMPRSLNFEGIKTNNTFRNDQKNITLISDFKPSPSLGSFHEHNKYTVPPALPEPKIANYKYSFPEKATTALDWTAEHSIAKPWPRISWNDVHKNDIPKSEDWFQKDTEYGSVKFPPATSYDHPYKYVTAPDNLAPGSYLPITEKFPFNQPVDIYTTPRPTPSLWSKFMSTIGLDYRGSEPPQKSTTDYNLLEKPVYYSQQIVPQPQRTHDGFGPSSYSGYPTVGLPGGYGYGHSGHSALGAFGGFGDYGGYGGFKGGMSPWKKVIKFLAAVIPVGLFLSALAPTVIQVQAVNDTMMNTRYRNDDSKEDLAKRFASSLSYFNKLNEDGCEDKVLCELLVSASFSENAEQNIRNLLDNFMRSEELQNKKDDLLKIFEAVKHQDCQPIQCGIKTR